MATLEGTGLSTGQQTALDAFMGGENLFITGVAGTGKSFLLGKIIEEATLMSTTSPPGIDVSVTASTGIAAVSIGGTTLHSWAGCGLLEHSPVHHTQIMLAGVRARWLRTRVLVVDEVSMLSAETLGKLDKIGRLVRQERGLPFGGIQLVLVGDFLQLPPVEGTMAFEHKRWGQLAGRCICLQEVFRQKDEATIRILGEIRMGKLSPEAQEVLGRQVVGVEPPKKRQRTASPSEGDPATTDPPLPKVEETRLFPTKAEAEGCNLIRLFRLPGEFQNFKARGFGSKKDLALLVKNCQAPDVLELKIGAQVLLVRNLDLRSKTQPLCNGSQGIVIGFMDDGDKAEAEGEGDTKTGFPIVRFENGRVQTITPATWKSKRGHKVVATFTQIPLCLGWAITIHKSQGMTLEKASLSLSKVFSAGQAYVALSRIRDLKKLKLMEHPDPSYIRADKRAVRFYRGLLVDEQNSI